MNDLDPGVGTECDREFTRRRVERSGIRRPDARQHGDDRHAARAQQLDNRPIERWITEPLAHDHVDVEQVVGEAVIEIDHPGIEPVRRTGGRRSRCQQVDRHARCIESRDVESPIDEPERHGAGVRWRHRRTDRSSGAGRRRQARVRAPPVAGVSPLGLSRTARSSGVRPVVHLSMLASGRRRDGRHNGNGPENAEAPRFHVGIIGSVTDTDIDEGASTQTSTGWLSSEDLELVRAHVPIVYVDAVPVRVRRARQRHRGGLVAPGRPPMGRSAGWSSPAVCSSANGSARR